MHAVFDAKSTHFVGEMSDYALSENLNKVSKIVIFGQKWHFCPKNSIFIFLLQMIAFIVSSEDVK